MKLRKATEDDLMLYYTWANEIEVRINSINQEEIPLPDHIKWFHKKLNDKDSILLVFEEDKELGQLRVEIDRQKNEAVISISIDKQQRGKGYGTKILIDTYEYYQTLHINMPLTGYVKIDNFGSIKSFVKAGFIKEEETHFIEKEEYYVFKKYPFFIKSN